jgi:molybdopterin converting factor subunit 1
MTSHSDELRQQPQDAPHLIRVRLLYFAAAREEVGRAEEQLEVSAPATAASVLAEVLDAHPALRRFGRSLLVAVNEEYAGAETRVRAGDEVAIFPPVSGGAGEAGSVEAHEQEASTTEDFFELTTDPINVGAVARRIVPPQCGATVTLDGYVRRFTRGRDQTLYLIYEAYEPMARAEMIRLGVQAHEKFEIAHIGIVHRTGRLEIGETSVVISVSAPHRRAAFEACEWAIRELKRTVPIWKKEFFAGGEVWIEGEDAPAV